MLHGDLDCIVRATDEDNGFRRRIALSGQESVRSQHCPGKKACEAKGRIRPANKLLREIDVRIDDLARCISIVLRKAEMQGIMEVTAPDDGYLTINSPEWRDIYVERWPAPGVGAFSDDEEQLSKILDAPENATAVDVERVAHLLRLLSDLMAGM